MLVKAEGHVLGKSSGKNQFYPSATDFNKERSRNSTERERFSWVQTITNGSAAESVLNDNLGPTQAGL